MFAIYLIPILFNLFILKGLFDFSVLNYTHVRKYIIFTKINENFAYTLNPEYLNNPQIRNNFDSYCNIALEITPILSKINMLKNLKLRYEKRFKCFSLILFSFCWFQIVFYYLFNLWFF